MSTGDFRPQNYILIFQVFVKNKLKFKSLFTKKNPLTSTFDILDVFMREAAVIDS